MKKILFITFISLQVSCGSNPQKPINTKAVKASSGEMILLGLINKTNLQTSDVTSWFNQEYDKITIDPNWGKDLRPYLKDLEIKIFMGTWCEDSQREIPHFFKLLDQLEFDQNNIKIYAMSEEKTTPQNFEKGLEIYNVPTLIFLKNGNEMNRFVEFPVNSMEIDLAQIIKGEAYTHSYQ
ncbi:MAG: thioredoxin family protein [Flavobacteriaceae bacterium]|jgi:thiol-disulfide isomerase/thioredoxin